jgi:rhomboid protease GluP
MAAHGALLTQDVIAGKWQELFTSMFLHFGIDHLASNMIVLIAVGLPLEKLIGPVRFGIIYLVSGLAGNVLSMALELRTGLFAVSAGASGAVLGLMGAVIYCMIRHRGYVGGLSLRRVILSVALTLYMGFSTSGINNAAHVGGLICGFAMAVLLYHPKQRRTV